MIFLVDLDGPILDVSAKYYRVYAEFVDRKGGKALDRNRFWELKRRGASGSRILGETGAGRRPEAAELDVFMREVIESEEYLGLDLLQPGVHRALSRLREAGWRVVLVTLRRRSAGVAWQLERLGLQSLFDAVLVREGNRGRVDEKRDLVRESLGKDLGPADVMVGDSELDVAVARALGVRAIAVTSGLREGAALAAASPDAILSGLEPVVDLVLGAHTPAARSVSPAERRIGIGIVGFGNWGPRVARLLSQSDDADLRAICDLSEERRAAASRHHQGVRTTDRVEDLLSDSSVRALYIATPVGTHEGLAMAALEAGKDVLVEKPLTADAAGARRCVERAEQLGRILMVGHTFVYSPPVRRIRDLVAAGELGRILYLDSSRVNLGLFQKDVSVIWDLAPHDLSIALFVTGSRAVSVFAHGKSFFGANNLEDVASLTVEFENGMVGYFHISWLSPVKLRRTTVVGDLKMIVYDDLEPVEKVKVYDRRVERPAVTAGFGDFQLTYRFGDVLSPVLDAQEPLALETRAFLEAVRTRQKPESDARFGLEIVKILEAAGRSLKESGFVRIEGT
jgi:predicted dehydrogenase/phosphoglycolate phosphatase-like HAD superfamily hydrolase